MSEKRIVYLMWGLLSLIVLANFFIWWLILTHISIQVH